MADKLKELKPSTIHRIVAAVLEIVEASNFTPQVDVNLQEAENDQWKMVFQKNSTCLDELAKIKESLGKNFTINVSPKDKNSISISVEAPYDDFLQLK